MMKQPVKQLMDEPGCEHNSKAKSGCSAPKPGATAGGCAFDGAQITLLPIADVAHLIHGPIGCTGSAWDNRGTKSSGPQLYRLGFTSDMSEQDVIMGYGERRLEKAIAHIVAEYQPAAVFIYNTCVPALEGDDLEAIAAKAEAKHGIAVIGIDSAGFYGSKNLGNRIAGEVMLDKVIGTAEPAPKPVMSDPSIEVHDIALIGEFNIAGEFWLVQRLLDELGIRVLGTLAGDARFKEIQTMHRAEVNMLVCSRALLNVARKLEKQYGTPWFEGSFYGVHETSNSLRKIASMIGDPSLMARTELVIAREKAIAEAALAPYREKLAGKRVLLYTGGVKSWSIVSALQDLGIEVVATGTRKSTEADKARIIELMGDDAIMLDDPNPRNLLDIAYQYRADMMVAGGRNMYTAFKARLPFVDVNQEREHAFAGYEGMVELARQLTLSLESPVWQAARGKAPWHQQVITIQSV
jgi:nitrogenase molybdenum-cofactor synthesis protein NifE